MTGCADLKLSSTFWVKRTDMEATVGCQSNGRTWRLVCRGTSWLGDVGNCSGDDALGGARLPTMTSAAYYISDDVDQTAVDFTSSLPTGDSYFFLVYFKRTCPYLQRIKWTETRWSRVLATLKTVANRSIGLQFQTADYDHVFLELVLNHSLIL